MRKCAQQGMVFEAPLLRQAQGMISLERKALQKSSVLSRYDELRNYSNDRSIFLATLRDTIEAPWQSWELQQLPVRRNLAPEQVCKPEACLSGLQHVPGLDSDVSMSDCCSANADE